jgi:hypothetical protein
MKYGSCLVFLGISLSLVVQACATKDSAAFDVDPITDVQRNSLTTTDIAVSTGATITKDVECTSIPSSPTIVVELGDNEVEFDPVTKQWYLSAECKLSCICNRIGEFPVSACGNDQTPLALNGCRERLSGDKLNDSFPTVIVSAEAYPAPKYDAQGNFAYITTPVLMRTLLSKARAACEDKANSLRSGQTLEWGGDPHEKTFECNPRRCEELYAGRRLSGEAVCNVMPDLYSVP